MWWRPRREAKGAAGMEETCNRVNNKQTKKYLNYYDQVLQFGRAQWYFMGVYYIILYTSCLKYYIINFSRLKNVIVEKNISISYLLRSRQACGVLRAKF